MTNTRASVIIPTFNGKDKLINLLQSLEKQSVSDVEIIVVIDGSTDDTVHYIQSFPWKLISLKLIEQKNKGRAGARNTGAREATSELLLFFDDDMIVDSTCIEKHLHFHQLHSCAIGMGKIIEPASNNASEIVQYKDFLNTGWNNSLQQYSQQALPSHLVILSAANFSISKTIFFELNGFDELLKDIEDYDFALRTKKHGVSTCYLDDAITIHKDTFTFVKYGERSKSYLKNRKFAAQLKPDLYADDVILSHKHAVVNHFFYALLKYPFWLTLFDSCNIFIYILPQKMRYKLYGITITAYIHSQPK